MRALIVGSDTPLGVALVCYFGQRKREYVALSKTECRWKSERQAKKLLRRSGCDIAIDTRVQAAADGGIRVHDIDVERSAWLARASQALKLPYMQLSCARVFSGNAHGGYREEETPEGSSSIARLLIAAEAAGVENCERHLVLRLGPVFAPSGTNVVTHMLRQLHSGQPLALDRSQSGCPVPADDAARVISGMLDQISCGLEVWGIYHYCSADITDCFEFAEVVLAAASQYAYFPAGSVKVVEEKTANSVNRRLGCVKIRNTFAIKQQPWRASVASQVKQFYTETKQEELAGVESYRYADASA